MVILYGHPESGHTYKIALTLELAGIPFEYGWVDVFKPRDRRGAEFQAASRYGEIPALVDEGQPMVQSNAILLHLANRHRTLGGENAASLAQAREWLLGSAPSIVDIACFAYICYDDIELDLTGFPRLRDWMNRMLELPRWRHPYDLLAKPA